MHDHVLALSDSLKGKDVQSTSQSRQDIMNCFERSSSSMVRTQREPGSNYKIPDYVPRDSVNSVALRAFRENWCLVGTHRRNPKYVVICCSCKAQSI